ncbi:helix-turn-helix transcriptional regulator [Bradyrhizobium sacchari]|nr:response regulator transcription factor [Bradyrhizobium sacchari]OPY96566.1 helix-turn-helix transcriptional regulator [Bradyrhizobium sacchari]TWB67349.1 LuxR family two component transcriptional regulator [Bradyrhizobium sacchari]
MRRRQICGMVLLGKNVLIREGIARILHTANFRIAISASNPEELPSSLQAEKLMFLIIHSDDDFGIEIAQIGYLKDRYPNAPIAVVSDNYRPTELASAFRAGANGYFVNVNSCDAFIKSVELVTMGETVFPPALLRFALDGSREHERETTQCGQTENAILVAPADAISPQLSPRERAILSCLIEGDSNKGIARKIDIAEATVKVHVKAILRKIRVQNRTQAAIWGMNHESQVRASNNHAPTAIDAGAGVVTPLKMISETDHLNQTPPLIPDHAATTPIDGRIRKGSDRGSGAAIRLYK